MGEADHLKQEKSTEDAEDEVTSEGGTSIPRASKTLIEMESWKEKAHNWKKRCEDMAQDSIQSDEATTFRESLIVKLETQGQKNLILKDRLEWEKTRIGNWKNEMKGQANIIEQQRIEIEKWKSKFDDQKDALELFEEKYPSRNNHRRIQSQGGKQLQTRRYHERRTNTDPETNKYSIAT